MLSYDIGVNAGVIWYLLRDNGKLSMKQIGKLTNYNDVQTALAVGWLARESKIHFFDEKGIIYIELKEVTAEIYY